MDKSSVLDVYVYGEYDLIGVRYTFLCCAGLKHVLRDGVFIECLGECAAFPLCQCDMSQDLIAEESKDS